MTFTIVAFDRDQGQWGVASASKFLAVGAAVPFARAGGGAIATQSVVNIDYGIEGLERLASGESAEDALKAMIGADSGSADRQVAAVDRMGGVAAFTGEDCFEWAGHHIGTMYACLGNLLTGRRVVDRMAETFEQAEGYLARRLVSALASGEAEGGDKRGKQSACLLVVGASSRFLEGSDRIVDLRVDDHPEPIAELARLLGVYESLFPPD